MDRILKCDHSLESCCAELYCSGVCFPILSILSGVKRLGILVLVDASFSEGFIVQYGFYSLC